MKVTIFLERDGDQEERTFDISDIADGERPTVLDILLSLREEIPDLAFRYGCRNKLCGVCTVDVNGKPRLACRTPARYGISIAAPKGLPILQDLVVKRDAVNKQLKGRLPKTEISDEARRGDHAAYDSLGRCIECYACLDGCPMHAKNDPASKPDEDNKHHDNGYEYGNPYSLLRLMRVLAHPGATTTDTAQTLKLADELGLDSCIDCKGCVCGVGINLMEEVVTPLLTAAGKKQ